MPSRLTQDPPKTPDEPLGPTSIDLLGDLLHGELAVGHVLAVELDAEQPGRDAADVEVGHLVVDVDPLLVLGHHRALRVGVVVDGGVGRHLPQGGVLQAAQDVLEG